jgi:hypothetical protein
LINQNAPMLGGHQLAHLILTRRRPGELAGRSELDRGGVSYQRSRPREGALRLYLATMADLGLEWIWNGHSPCDRCWESGDDYRVDVARRAVHTEDAQQKARVASGRLQAGHRQLGSRPPRPLPDDRPTNDPQRIRDLYLRLEDAAERGHW